MRTTACFPCGPPHPILGTWLCPGLSILAQKGCCPKFFRSQQLLRCVSVQALVPTVHLPGHGRVSG